MKMSSLKDLIDSLPGQRMWDHAIELKPEVKPSACKVYPLASSEQLQPDEFLQENLHTNHIHLSTSPMVSPVFLIKKKDRSLQLVQDYCVLTIVCSMLDRVHNFSIL